MRSSWNCGNFKSSRSHARFRVPPHMLFDLGRATWSNVESLGREVLVFCLQPMLRAWESALRRALLTPE